MKKTILIFIAAIGASHIQAQNINPDNDHTPQSNHVACDATCKKDNLSRWILDVNATGGLLTQQITTAGATANYKNAVNQNISGLNFNNGMSVGADAEIGFFFGHKRHIGIGTGLLYMYQQGNMTMDNFHVEYQATDNFGNTFRQVVSSDGQIKEKLTVSNFNIPLLLKYKTRFSKHIGFTADAGVLFNVQEMSSYNTNASFDYEAIYDYTPSGGTVYDNAHTPGASDLLITKAQYEGTHTNGNIQNYFNTLRNDGYNVGLGVKANNNTGNVSYTSGSVGLLVRPAISFYVAQNVALNLGVYYIYQNFNNNASANGLTDKVGNYTSVLSGVTKSVNNVYGISFGVRVFLCNHKAPHAEVAVVETPEEELAPVVTDVTPEAPPVKEEEKEEPESVPDITTPILFNLNKATLQKEYYSELEEAAKELKENPKARMTIHGYTDISGNNLYNMALSKKRAYAVKSYLRKKGVKAKSIRTVGHGSKSPAASNKTAEGRALNRRVMMKMK